MQNPSRIGRTRIAVLRALLDGAEISPKEFAEEHGLTANRVCNVLRDLSNLLIREDRTSGMGGRRVVYKANNPPGLKGQLAELTKQEMDISALAAVWR